MCVPLACRSGVILEASGLVILEASGLGGIGVILEASGLGGIGVILEASGLGGIGVILNMQLMFEELHCCCLMHAVP